MALELIKEVRLNGNAKIGETAVVQMSSTISSDAIGGTGYTEYIVDNDLYVANLTEVRKNIRAFKDAVYSIEDELLAEIELAKEPALEEETPEVTE